MGFFGCCHACGLSVSCRRAFVEKEVKGGPQKQTNRYRNATIWSEATKIEDQIFSFLVGEEPANTDAKEACSGMEEKELFNTIGFSPADKEWQSKRAGLSETDYRQSNRLIPESYKFCS